ncbi:monovalent cation:H+ antiporter-2, CPA2 family [Geodermatophilus obscurus]|uniref:Monovalent cation:H+ antiporter-2, CPA2 family n=1 Tax=Geodermatophilus obscurus TaxID=1861 RepID=A0A1M7ULV0_9ACTN|nr:hypothetical protein [Geodermatophilus obscurus]SHN83875.1 monovalent cation:H+ antiporter-2, CPA2 family [Geodermatophilus obscurus]
MLGGASGVAEAATGIGVAFAFMMVLSVVARHGTRWVSALLRTRDGGIVVVLALALGLGVVVLGAGWGRELAVVHRRPRPVSPPRR